MPNITATYGQIAQAALAVMDTATVKADDNTLALVQGARKFLRDVISGALTVVPSQPAQQSQSAAPAASSKAAGATMPAPPTARRQIPPASRAAATRVRQAPIGADGVQPAAAPTKAILGPPPLRGAGGVVSAAVTGAPKT
jgi:hypothetical protein